MMDMEEVPELNGIKMLVKLSGWDDWKERTIYGYDPKTDKYIGHIANYDEVKPLQKQPEEMTVEQICKELGRDIKIKKG